MIDLTIPLLHTLVDKAEWFCAHSQPGMPPDTWWLAAIVLLILGAAATIDAFTATVPDGYIFLGILAVTLSQGLHVSWPYASHHLICALAFAIGLWAINTLWYGLFQHDAFGMGDAKWSLLAVACFDYEPVLYAWAIGACLGVIWISAAWIVRRPIRRVYFAPFLFIGLIVGLWWLRFRMT